MFREALTEIVRRLNEAKAHGLLRAYALIGGFAVSAWGVPRATRDIDFAVALSSIDPTAVASQLGAEFHRGEPDDPLRGVFRADVVTEDQPIPVQLIVLPPEWTELVFGSLETLAIHGCSLPVVSWQTLILLKLYAGSPHDLIDARDVLAVRRPTQEDLRKLSRMAERVGLSKEFANLSESPQ